jgi:Kef-type K+ transport system membrane component KefB
MFGTKLVFEYTLLIDILPIALMLYGTVLILQVLSAGLAARITGKYHWHESVMIGLGMLGRAELAFIVIDLAYVENGLITTGQFYALMITIFLLNITVQLAIK